MPPPRPNLRRRSRDAGNVQDNGPATPLLAAYFERRDELRRFFVARTGSAPEADDLLQELYLKVADATPPAELRKPGAYLYRLAANVMLDRLRQQRRAGARDGAWREANTTVAANEAVNEEPDAEAALAARQRLARVLAAVETLPPQTRRVFRMHKIEGLSHAEVAARLGVSKSAVEKHMIAALKRLLEERAAWL
jgi:RNA polymerase sigma factor (sigma-70 family)